VSDFQQLSSGLTPPLETDCFSVDRRRFGAAAMQNSCNLTALYNGGNDGHGVTIAITDSFGDPNIAAASRTSTPR
jgi:Predicted protease